MKYTHRISIPATFFFDVETDNPEIVDSEIQETLDGIFGKFEDGLDISDDVHGRMYLDTTEKGFDLSGFEVTDTTENSE